MMRWAGCAHDRRGHRPTAAGAGTKQIDHACRFCGMVVSDMGYAGKGDVAIDPTSLQLRVCRIFGFHLLLIYSLFTAGTG